MIDISVLQRMLEAAGLEPIHYIYVVYGGKDATDFCAAERLNWTLKTAGFENLSIINGGLSAWRVAQYPLLTGEVVTRQKQSVC